MKINSYLTFNGNCRQAMNFYQQCLGGKLNFQTIGESPLSHKMPARMKALILHASLSNDELYLMGTDLVNGNQLMKGNAVSLSLHCNSETQFYKCYQKLSDEGIADHPPEISFWGALIGDLIDKYGHRWVLSYDINKVRESAAVII